MVVVLDTGELGVDGGIFEEDDHNLLLLAEAVQERCSSAADMIWRDMLVNEDESSW